MQHKSLHLPDIHTQNQIRFDPHKVVLLIAYVEFTRRYSGKKMSQLKKCNLRVMYRIRLPKLPNLLVLTGKVSQIMILSREEALMSLLFRAE